jgi:cytochrome P450
LTDRRLIKELLDKRSSKYSDRPANTVEHLITQGDHVLALPYGNSWREFRKLMHQFFNESLVEREYVNIQNAEAVQMLRDFCICPEEHMLHPKRFSNSIAMSISIY